MGAKQSKRSVDITGKEAEGAGEVAAAGAGGEGRVEPLADADALKPQLNGAAHIHEQTDKEKQLDSGTPENEKDATTEKESKEQEKENEKDKEVPPTTNGDNGEQKEENGDSSPAPEDGKKPKKEKVKKKWSLRSISFSRKDKPKPEKKQKEEEPKTNGEPEKVPEEAAETSPEPATNEVAEEAKPETENKDDKTPDTPVTEPLTNGSATPESPKTETPVAEEPVAAVPETNRPETVADPAPDQLPINGLSIDESKSDATEVTQSEECKPEKTTADTAELVPAPEIPVKKEVCVEQMPLIEPTPPPLPTNPPPSSVASFAATTMAPELTDASLSNNTESAIFSPPPNLDISAELPKNDIIAPKEDVIQNKIISENKTEIPSTLNEEPAVVILKSDSEIKNSEPFQCPIVEINDSKVESPSNKTSETIQNETLSQEDKMSEKINIDILDTVQNDASSQKDAEEKKKDNTENCMLPPIDNEIAILSQDLDTVSDSVDDLPPPLPVDNDVAQTEITENVHLSLANNDKEETLTNSNHTVEFIGEKSSIDTESLLNGNNENIVDEHNSKDSVDVVRNIVECNGNIEESNHIFKEGAIPSDVTNIEIEKVATTPDDSLPPSLSEANDCLPATEAGEASESFPLPPSELCRSESEPSPAASPEPTDVAAPSPQELVSDKIADLIPEVPVIPELQTETETSTDVAVAN